MLLLIDADIVCPLLKLLTISHVCSFRFVFTFYELCADILLCLQLMSLCFTTVFICTFVVCVILFAFVSYSTDPFESKGEMWNAGSVHQRLNALKYLLFKCEGFKTLYTLSRHAVLHAV